LDFPLLRFGKENATLQINFTKTTRKASLGFGVKEAGFWGVRVSTMEIPEEQPIKKTMDRSICDIINKTFEYMFSY